MGVLAGVSVQGATTQTVEAIRSIGTTIRQMSEIATTIASAVEEQGSATQEISRNVLQAAQGTQEVSSNIIGVSDAARQTGGAATQVLASAGELSRNGEVLKAQGKLEIGDALHITLRTAEALLHAHEQKLMKSVRDAGDPGQE